MCGRYVSPDTASIERAWHIGRRNGNPFAARYNVCPTTQIPILRRDGSSHELEITEAKWSFVPTWWKNPKPPANSINARVEEAASKPMWKYAFRSSRCLVPALGYYEWQQATRTDPETGEIKPYKQPYYLTRPDKKLFCFGGLMSMWTQKGKDPILTCALMTRAAAPSVEKIHDRMPVVLPDELFDKWLDPKLQNAEEIAAMIEKSQTDFVCYPVSTRLNAAKDGGSEELLEPVELGQL